MDVEHTLNLYSLTYRELLSRIGYRYLDAELVFACRVVNDYEREVNFFLRDFSISIFNYMGRCIMEEQPICLINGTICFYIGILDKYLNPLMMRMSSFGQNALYKAINGAHIPMQIISQSVDLPTET